MGYGLDAELKAKQDAKYDANLEREVIDWINAHTNAGLAPGNVHEPLKDGVVLCKLANKIKPGVVPRFAESKMAFKQMENINAFLMACKKIGFQILTFL